MVSTGELNQPYTSLIAVLTQQARSVFVVFVAHVDYRVNYLLRTSNWALISGSIPPISRLSVKTLQPMIMPTHTALAFSPILSALPTVSTKTSSVSERKILRWL